MRASPPAQGRIVQGPIKWARPRDYIRDVAAMSERDNGQAKIEITPDMIEAGGRVFTAWEDSDDWRVENLVAALYQAMRALEHQPLASRVEAGDR